MSEFLKQISEYWDDSVDKTSETLSPDIDGYEDDSWYASKNFDDKILNLSINLTDLIDDKWVADELVGKIIISANNDITELINQYWENISNDFDQFNDEFDAKFWYSKLGSYIDDRIASESFISRGKSNVAKANSRTERELAKLGL